MRRLKEDPSVSDGLRDALLEEEEIVGDYDLGALRERVVAGPKTGPIAPRGLKWVAVIAVSGFTAAVVTLALQPDTSLSSQPTSAPVIEVLSIGEQHRPRRAVEPNGPQAPEDPPAEAPPAAEISSLDPSGVETRLEGPEEPAPTPVHEDAVATAPEAALMPLVPSGLAAELASYNLGLDAAARGDWRAARDAYTQYLREWPRGQMQTEGWLGLLGATVESSSPAAAEKLAAEMLTRGGLGSRRDDVVLVRAEALVQLGRCDDALDAIQEFRRGTRVNSIKQSCKRARRNE